MAAKMTRRPKTPRYDIFDTTGTDQWRLQDGVASDAVEIAHAVTAQVAAELAGLTVQWIEAHAGKHGEMGVSCFSPEGGRQELFIRRVSHDA